MEAREPKSAEEFWFKVEGERDTTESIDSALKFDRQEYVFVGSAENLYHRNKQSVKVNLGKRD